MQQGALPLIWPERYGREEFLLAKCNRLAFEAVVHGADKWKTGALILTGAAFSGKTHLVHIFADLHEIQPLVSADQLRAAIEETTPFMVIDSADKLLQENPDLVEIFFHLVNGAFLGQWRLLLTMRDAPADWVVLPDLLSRLQSCQQVALQQPDEEMIRGAYRKLFADRGLMVENKVLDYLALRSERSFAGIFRNVETLDARSLETGRKITIPLIQSALVFE